MPQKKSSKLPLQKFAMVGTGIQGTQVAMIAARTGYDVTVFDPREGAFRQTFEKIRTDLKAKKVTPIIAWIKSIGFVPLTVKKELLGFCFNRVWRAIKRETLYMWGNGFVNFMDVDRAWIIFTRMKEGPFALMDKVGLDVIWDIEMVYYNDSKDPKDRPPRALKDMIDCGELGVKSGKGFYTYPNPAFLQPDFFK